MDLGNLKISAKLNLAFGAVAALTLVVAGGAWVSMHRMHAAAQTLTNESVPKALTAANWQISVLQSARHTRNVLILDDPESIKLELAALEEQRKARERYIEKLDQQVSSEYDRLEFQAIADARAAYVPVEDEFMKIAAAGDRAGAKKVLLERTRPLQLKYAEALQKFVDAQEAAVGQSAKDSEAAYVAARWVAAVLGLGLVAAFGLVRRILKQLGRELDTAAELAGSVTRGDLSVQIQVTAGDTTSLMAQLKDMQASLVQVVSKVRENAEGVATASSEIAQGNNDLSKRTEQQAGALELTASSIEELSSTVRQNADNASQANQLALGASTVAVKGGQVVGQVVDTMRGINESSNKIAEIIGVIDSFACQTNRLALNGAVEAARAGEQGRGFAVVASEVRSLAQRSAGAAKEIKALIGASVERVEQGTALVDQAGVTMTEIVNAIRRVTDIMREISSASVEQSSGVAQVSQAVTQMDTTTQQNAALVEQSAAAAENLRVQAQQLVQAVAVFRLRPGDVPQAAFAPG